MAATVKRMVPGVPGEIVTLVVLRVRKGPCLPVGVIVVLSEMLPVNPLMLVRAMVVVVEVSGGRDSFVGLGEIEKSLTAIVAGFPVCIAPLASVTLRVMVNVPAIE